MLSGIFGKKRLNARGFEREYLRSCSGYRPGWSIKRRGKSSSLHSKKTFWKLGYNLSLLILWMTCWGLRFKSYDLSKNIWLISWLINLFILDHNFWTRNARKSIKGSKDSDSSLVSNENFSKTLWPSGWALGQATWAKMTAKLLHLWRHSLKIHTPQPKKFFSSAIY